MQFPELMPEPEQQEERDYLPDTVWVATTSLTLADVSIKPGDKIILEQPLGATGYIGCNVSRGTSSSQVACPASVAKEQLDQCFTQDTRANEELTIPRSIYLLRQGADAATRAGDNVRGIRTVYSKATRAIIARLTGGASQHKRGRPDGWQGTPEVNPTLNDLKAGTKLYVAQRAHTEERISLDIGTQIEVAFVLPDTDLLICVVTDKTGVTSARLTLTEAQLLSNCKLSRRQNREMSTSRAEGLIAGGANASVRESDGVTQTKDAYARAGRKLIDNL